jgi:DNA-binding CsgD family transcriptional regulator/putative methionine-R-sulfoxide reductase with GAF domain
MYTENPTEELDELRSHLRILSRTTAAAIADYGEIDELLDQIVNIICEELGYDHFGIGLAGEEGRIVYRAGCGMPEEYKSHLNATRGEGIIGWVFQTGEPLLVPDVRREPRYLEKRSTTSSELCVPLRTHKRMIGVINVESDRRGRFTSRDLELLTTIANVVSGSLQRILQHCAAAERDTLKLESLTPREREVLRNVIAGISNKEIAQELKIKVNTVETHLRHIFTKLGVQSRTEAMAWVEQQEIWRSQHS